jgi:iron(III) transport system permease protein
VGSETANGSRAASCRTGVVWLLLGRSRAGDCGRHRSGLSPGEAHKAAWLLAGGLAGLLGGLLASGFLIGAQGLVVRDGSTASFGELAINQFGMGIGGFVVLLALVDDLRPSVVARLGLLQGRPVRGIGGRLLLGAAR